MTAGGLIMTPRAPQRSLPRAIRRVVVLGANGTMGFRCGALFASAGVEVTMLARTREKAEEGIGGARKTVRSSTIAEWMTPGSYEHDLQEAVSEADLIFEAVAENLATKHEILEKVDRYRREDSIVATVSSGLSISGLAGLRSESFQRSFLGLHFFNPPNVIAGTELIAGENTDPEIVDFVERFCNERLGRVMVRTADTPAFAGNRIGFKVMNEVAQLAEEYGAVLMDRLVGPYTGRAMAPLATIDLVGWDVHQAIVDNVHANAKDEANETLRMPDSMKRFMARGVLGTKSGGGFFKTGEAGALALDLKSGSYVPVKSVKLPKLDFINQIQALHRVGDYERGMKLFAQAKGPEAALAQKVIAGYIAYAFNRVGEVTESITGIDLIMGAGFNWAPPGLLVDTIGLRETVDVISRSGLKVPVILEDALRRRRREKFFTDPRFDVGKFFVAR